ncbi:NAD(P)-binding protein [Boletus reticuloceps]|uniref:NAD(P)-binding protein n=1 Tax=Boletus reticuloceps TaxID=495285 RepID=A0A8I3A853_9AGAM|nr:NAD(P)-binding protein [Boletus reticuloceps]
MPALGAKVTAHYNTQRDPLLPLLQTYPTLHIVQADLADETAVVDLFAALSRSDAGLVQVLVVNHAIADRQRVPVVDMTLARWNRILKGNLTSAFLVCREYLKHLRQASSEAKDKAAIVLVGSTAGKFGEAGNADYSVAKSGMMYGLTMTLKNEIVKIAPRGRVNTVAPGWVYTPRVEALLAGAEIRYSALATMPLKKIALPIDVATQIVVLSSSAISGHVTGQVLMVDGGMEGRVLNKPEDI